MSRDRGCVGYASSDAWGLVVGGGYPATSLLEKTTDGVRLYCRALGFVILEELEIEGQQAGEFLFERT